MKINGIKANGKDYDIWATSAEVEELNNQGNAALGKELESGKQSIVDAINAKGGDSTVEESLSELANDVSNVIFDITTDISFEEGFNPSNAYDIVMNRNKIKSLICRGVTFTNIQLQNLTGLEHISFPDFITTFFTPAIMSNSAKNLKTIHLDNSIQLSLSQSLDYTTTDNSVDFYAEKCTSFNGGIARNFKIGRLFLGDVTTLNTGSAGYYSHDYLYVLSLKSGDGNFNCANWKASIVGPLIGWDKMNENLYEYTLSKLADHSQDGITRTFNIGWLANVSQENKDYATNKGWTLL